MKLHHLAIICSDYSVSKAFYTQILGLDMIREVYRAERQSYKLDLGLNGQYVVELFSFPHPPQRPSHPEACGLRHIAFSVEDIEAQRATLLAKKIPCEPIRTDEWTDKKFFFTQDPDGLPIEFYEA
ncbi:SMU1112c/YaeR family gloxylase I-like metalloprotein [Riemerella columbina]|uniref:SMU1112c/YaeR family gloxylase I-like metalloprotein n=1 Tax=Riemerella columbina TaxID=103810 RepID=UPI00266F4CEC|nr:VOC family protein [Riemerella columbina]WKS94646.1 VOC family protein [Riemerella columbina]